MDRSHLSAPTALVKGRGHGRILQKWLGSRSQNRCSGIVTGFQALVFPPCAKTTERAESPRNKQKRLLTLRTRRQQDGRLKGRKHTRFVEQLEDRLFLSVGPGGYGLFGLLAEGGQHFWPAERLPAHADYSWPSALVADGWQVQSRPRGADAVDDFRTEGDALVSRLSFRFQGLPSFHLAPQGGFVTLASESLWLQPGEPVVPVRVSTLLLPARSDSLTITVHFSSQAQPLSVLPTAVLTPMAVVGSQTTEGAASWTGLPTDVLTSLTPVRYQLHTFRGFTFATIQVFPVHWDDTWATLIYHEEMTLQITASSSTIPQISSTAGAISQNDGQNRDLLPHTLRLLPEDISLIASYVDNPAAITTYVTATVPAQSPRLPWAGHFEYVVITSEQLQAVFERLVDHKKSRGLSATIVTIELIGSRYTGTESGDLADRIRQFISEAYLHWGTSWILLGGDVEIIPTRGVYARVSSIVDTSLATDLYYACLDGPWDGNRNGIWGEPVDGIGRRDIDLVPEVFVGRAPVSSWTEAVYFVDKVIRYESYAHPQRTTVLWLGEELDSRTDGSISGEAIRRETLPGDWTAIERYDRDGRWSGEELRGLLNQSPHLVHHLGHASAHWNARLTVANVQSLTNSMPYVFYSQGCYSGAFDLYDLAIGEAHVVAPASAVAAVMNTRFGWYVPGPTPGGNHFYAYEFFDALFNEKFVHLGLAHHDSKLDNLFRVGDTGVYRWIHFTTILLGDPELPLQIGPRDPSGTPGHISGRVLADIPGTASVDSTAGGIAGVRVFVDTNNDRTFNEGSSLYRWSGQPTPIPDLGTLRATVEVDAPGQITQIFVSLSLEHQFLHDLEISLISPSGTRVKLLSRPPLGAGVLRDVTFRDDALRTISPQQRHISGDIHPAQALRAFEGEPAQGVWVLEIVDVSTRDSGILHGWNLSLGYAEPTTFTDGDGVFFLPQVAASTGALCVEPPVGWFVVAPIGEAYPILPQPHLADSSYNFLLAPIGQGERGENLGILHWLEEQQIAAPGSGTWWRFRAAHSGSFTAEATSALENLPIQIDLFDASGQRLARAYSPFGTCRLDTEVIAQREYLMRLTGQGQVVSLRAVNLLSFSDGKVQVFGSPKDDVVQIAVGQDLHVAINGVEYTLPRRAATSIEIVGKGGRDQLYWTSALGATSFVFRNGEALIGHTGLWVAAKHVASISLVAGGPTDSARIYGNSPSDRFVFTHVGAQFVTAEVAINLKGFERIDVWAGAGPSTIAQLGDTPGNDRIFLRPREATLYGQRVMVAVRGFATILTTSSVGGTDAIYFQDGPGEDSFTSTPRYAAMRGPGYFQRAEGFRWVIARSSYGADVAKLYDSPGTDSAVITSGYVTLTTPGAYTRVQGFAQVIVTATAGSGDIIRIFDSPSDDLFRLGDNWVELVTVRGVVVAKGFDVLRIYAQQGGADQALVRAPSWVSHVVLSPEWVRLVGPQGDWQFSGISQVRIQAAPKAGITSIVYDSSAKDRLVAAANVVGIIGPRSSCWLERPTRVVAVGRFGARLELAQNPFDYALELTGFWTPSVD